MGLSNLEFANLLVHARSIGKMELLPVVADQSFVFPGPTFYEEFEAGKVLALDNLRSAGITSRRLMEAYKATFNVLALRFSSHGSETIQQAEVHEMSIRLPALNGGHLKVMTEDVSKED